jgi:phosphoribosylamine--glycine ligase
MGAFSPVDLYSRMSERIEREITQPLQKALSSLPVPFRGVLYAGLMVDEKDQPYILEFNARFGDPETQVLMPLLNSDLTEILFACAQGKLADLKISWQDGASCCVVAAAKDYPYSSSKGETIEIGEMPKDCQVFHAGTALSSERLTTNGGRVLAVTAVAKSMAPARDLAYKALANVKFSGMDYRSDIAGRAVKQCLSS